MRRALLGVLAGFLLVPAAKLEGQVAWDGPLMVSPSTPPGWGLYLADPSPGSGIGVISSWRSGGPLGFRIGLAEDTQEELAVFGGVDVSGYFMRASDDFPVDIDWVTGAGFGVGDSFLMSFPLGLSVGRELVTDDLWFNPYITPRVVLDAYLGGDRPEDTLTLGLAVDLGMDISFDPGWAVRFAGSIGDRRALAIGVSFRLL
jgi:hypothetical protein